jgi:hypothetical protein
MRPKLAPDIFSFLSRNIKLAAHIYYLTSRTPDRSGTVIDICCVHIKYSQNLDSKYSRYNFLYNIGRKSLFFIISVNSSSMAICPGYKLSEINLTCCRHTRRNALLTPLTRLGNIQSKNYIPRLYKEGKSFLAGMGSMNGV